MEILVRQNFTEADRKKAEIDASEYRKSKAASGASNLLDLTDLKKSVVLCDSHARKFGHRKGFPYRLHPEHSRVIGRCDVCQAWGPGRFFLNEPDWLQAVKALEKWRRGLEYAAIVSG